MKYLVILLLIGLLPGTRLVAQPRDARSGITVTPRDITVREIRCWYALISAFGEPWWKATVPSL